MDKPKYRYNNKTGELDQLYRVANEVVEITGARNPNAGEIAVRELTELMIKEIPRVYNV